jgi:hypothetical protein
MIHLAFIGTTEAGSRANKAMRVFVATMPREPVTMPATAILEPFAMRSRVRDKATAPTMIAAMPKIAPLATIPKVAGIETSGVPVR